MLEDEKQSNHKHQHDVRRQLHVLLASNNPKAIFLLSDEKLGRRPMIIFDILFPDYLNVTTTLFIWNNCRQTDHPNLPVHM